MFCINCGADISPDDFVCPVCGNPVGNTVYSSHSQTQCDSRSASTGKRVKAFVADMLIILAGYLLLSMFFWQYAIYAVPVIALLYFTLTVSGNSGATVGMLFRGLRVEDYKTGEKADMGKALLRALVLPLFAFTCLFFIRLKDGRTLCDWISGTITVEK